MAQKHAPSELTLAGSLYHLALVEEDWMEVRFAGLPEREPWGGVDWDTDPGWEFRTACDLQKAIAQRVSGQRSRSWFQLSASAGASGIQGS